MNRDDEVYLTTDSARRTARVVSDFERQSAGNPQGSSIPRVFIPNWLAISAVAIPSRMGMVMSSGNVTVQAISSTGVISTMPGIPPLVGWNYTGGPIASGSLVVIIWVYGLWLIVSADCSASAGTTGVGTGTTVPPSMTPVTGGQAPRYQTITAAAAAADSDAGFSVDATLGSFPVTLPNGFDGRTFDLFNVSTNSNTYTIVAAGSQTIVPVTLPVGGPIGTGQYQKMSYRYLVPTSGTSGWYLDI